MTFNGLHGVIFQKIELFITAAVETSNPVYCFQFLQLFGTSVSWQQTVERKETSASDTFMCSPPGLKQKNDKVFPTPK
jgi:hypothetical protein